MAIKLSNNQPATAKGASSGWSGLAPDVCVTPAWPRPVPMPYPNAAHQSQAGHIAKKLQSKGLSAEGAKDLAGGNVCKSPVDKLLLANQQSKGGGLAPPAMILMGKAVVRTRP